MGSALSSLRPSVEFTVKNKMLILLSVAVVIVNAIIGFIPLVNFFSFLVTPVLGAGVVGVAYLGMNGEAVTFDKFTDVISEFWKSIAGAYLIAVGGAVLGVIFIIVITAVMGTFALGISGTATGTGMGGTTGGFGGASIAVLGLMLVLFVAYILFALVVQFLDVAVVIGGEDATGAFGESWSLVKEAPLSVLGYSILRFGLFIVAVAIPAVLAATLPDMIGVGLAIIAGTITIPVAYGAMFVYHARYYMDRRGLTPA